MRIGKRIRLLLLACAVAAPLSGVDTAFWQVGSFEEFLQGTLSNISLTREGTLSLAPNSRAIFSPEEALALSLARDRNQTLYIGTGHQGKVFRVNANQKAAMFFRAEEPDIFALAVGPEGALYVGSSPEGRVYRVTPDGKSKVFYDPKAKYIWALTFDSLGRLYVGTGDKGQIFRVDATGKGEVFFESKQTHIMCLALDREGNLLAGSVPNGLIYRITSQGKAFVLYQSNLPEIHDLATDSRGAIYAAAIGGAGGKGSPEILTPPPQAPGASTPMTVTVTASEETGSKQSPKGQNPPPAGEQTTAPSFNRPAPTSPTLPTLQIPQGRGSLIEISPDSAVETLWSSNNESIFGLAVRTNHVLFSTDSNGRIFELDPRRDGHELTLLTETHESLATRMILSGSDLYVATSNIAKLFRVEASPTHEGTYESPVKDTKFVSRWGVLAWRAEVPEGSSLEFYTRSGNSDRPDNTWSDWSGPYRDANGSDITSPAARYIQWKAAFRTSGSRGPTLDDVTASYLNQNLPPQIRSLNVSTSGERTGPTGSSSISGGSVSSGISVAPPPPVTFGASTLAGGAASKTPVSLTWQADDPNNDPLTFSLYIKGEDEQEWHLLKDKIRQTSFTIEPSALPDGKYLARLVASDEDANPPETARKSELISAPFWVDNTPPVVRVLKRDVEGERATVQFQAEDGTSPLRSAEASTDGQEWRDVVSDDGVVDSRVETFTLKLTKLGPGEHVIALRAYDTAGNVGVGKVVVRIPSGGGLPR